MRRSLLPCAAALSLAACVEYQQVPHSSAAICSSRADCDKKWEVARQFVEQHADEKITVFTPQVIETAKPGLPFGRGIGMRVTLESMGDDRYRIIADAYCLNVGCSRSPTDVVRLFNSYLKDADP